MTKKVEKNAVQVIAWQAEQIQQFQKDLLYWYDDRKRDLPWRENQDPYRIWVSEIMLQQTQVVTVIPYFERFMSWFPTIADLATAPEERLLKAWEGLGYYSRVRNMQVAAQQIMTEFGGEMPREIKDISSLKGIGPYTAGAVASIAFDLPEPAIDGNVMRVYSRLFEVEADIAKASSRKVFDNLVRQTISHDDPSGFNQGLMDLGATVCKPTSPECESCPLKQHCLSYSKGSTGNFPVKSKKAKAKPVYYVGQIIRNNQQQFLIEQRPETGVLSSLWQFPLVEWETATHGKEPMATLVAQFSSEYQEKISWQKKSLGEVTHIFSHLKWFIDLAFGVVKNDETLAIKANQKWVTLEEMQSYPLPKPQQKMVEILENKLGKQN